MGRVKKVGNLRLAGSPLDLREKGRKYLAEADRALAKARALYEEADRKERDGQKAEELFYRAQHLETCEECRKGGYAPTDREVGFHIAHLGRGGTGRIPG